MFTIDVHYYVVTTTVSYQVQNFRQGSSSLYKWTQYPRLESVLGLLHLYQHHFPWSRSDISGIDILSGPPHPVWLCTSGVLLPEYPHYCRCCMNTSGWTLWAWIYIVCMKQKATDVKITEGMRENHSGYRLWNMSRFVSWHIWHIILQKWQTLKDKNLHCQQQCHVRCELLTGTWISKSGTNGKMRFVSWISTLNRFAI